MNFEDIKELVEIVSTRNITEFELERAGVKIRISKQPPTVVGVAPVPAGDAPPAALTSPPAAAIPMVAAAGAAEVATTGTPAEAASEPEEEGLHPVKSPMVGTFYRAPSPTSPAYVKEGDEVTPGKVLCIVEAMKLMNEIECEVSGTIVKVHPENGQPVEYGEKLFSIRVH